jgi:hypothetical protein
MRLYHLTNEGLAAKSEHRRPACGEIGRLACSIDSAGETPAVQTGGTPVLQ